MGLTAYRSVIRAEEKLNIHFTMLYTVYNAESLCNTDEIQSQYSSDQRYSLTQPDMLVTLRSLQVLQTS